MVLRVYIDALSESIFNMIAASDMAERIEKLLIGLLLLLESFRSGEELIAKGDSHGLSCKK